MQIKRFHQDDSSTDGVDAEAQNDTSTMQWTVWALLKMAFVTLACGFIAGKHATSAIAMKDALAMMQ